MRNRSDAAITRAAAAVVIGLSLVALARSAQPLLGRAAGRAPAGAPPPRALQPSPRNDTRTGTQVARLRDGQPIDLNRASPSDLQLLPRIGPKLAARIVAYRERHGPFADVAQLSAVAGVGPATVTRLRPLVRVARRPVTSPL